MAKDHPTGNSGLYRAFLQLKTPEECYRFLQDVCSYSELSAMEQRYNIAELLADKCIYTEIMDKTGASSAIISRVSRVLSADDSVLRALLEAHSRWTGSTRARELLDNWAAARAKFVKVFPTEYKRALGEIYERQQKEKQAASAQATPKKEAVAAK